MSVLSKTSRPQNTLSSDNRKLVYQRLSPWRNARSDYLEHSFVMELRAIEMDRETGDWKWEEKSWKKTWRKKRIDGESNEKKIVFLSREYLASYEFYLKFSTFCLHRCFWLAWCRWSPVFDRGRNDAQASLNPRAFERSNNIDNKPGVLVFEIPENTLLYLFHGNVE